jgi:hypothetical protein
MNAIQTTSKLSQVLRVVKPAEFIAGVLSARALMKQMGQVMQQQQQQQPQRRFPSAPARSEIVADRLHSPDQKTVTLN